MSRQCYSFTTSSPQRYDKLTEEFLNKFLFRLQLNPTGAAVVDITSLLSPFDHSFSLCLSLPLTIDSLPNRQYDLDWTLMGGDFQFDPRLKRHHIFTVAATVLCSVSQSKAKKIPRLHQSQRTAVNIMLYDCTKHLSFNNYNLAIQHLICHLLTMVPSVQGTPCRASAAFSVCDAGQ